MYVTQHEGGCTRGQSVAVLQGPPPLPVLPLGCIVHPIGCTMHPSGCTVNPTGCIVQLLALLVVLSIGCKWAADMWGSIRTPGRVRSLLVCLFRLCTTTFPCQLCAPGIFFRPFPTMPVFAPPHQTIWRMSSPCLRIWPIFRTQFMMMARVVVGSGGSDILCCGILIFRLMQGALQGRFAV